MNTPQQRKFNVLLVGDSCIDVYQYGYTKKLSPEAPVPIFEKSYEERRDGMALNVRNNLQALGCQVQLITGDKLSVKKRLIDIKSRQHIIRVDEDNISSPIAYIPGFYHDAIVFSDYGKGSISYDLIEDTIKRFKGPVFVDTKKFDLSRFKDAIIKINSEEYLRSEFSESVKDLIVTYGDRGVSWGNRHYSVPKVEVSDVCGAGDTFLASLVYQYLNTKDLDSAITFAIKASAVTVQHVGVYSPKLEEIL